VVGEMKPVGVLIASVSALSV